MATPQEIIQAARDYVDAKGDKADSDLKDAIAKVEWAEWQGFELGTPPPIRPTGDFRPETPPEPPEFLLHDLKDASGQAPGAPPELQNIDSIVAESVGEKPTNGAVKPGFVPPRVPNQVAGFRHSAPSINPNFRVPAAPNWQTFAAPVLNTYDFPEAPQVLLPNAPSSALPDAPEAPSDLPGLMARGYRDAAPQFITMVNGYVDAQLTKLNPRYHEQMGRIETQLAKYLAGGTGLAPEVEDAIYARAQAKNDLEAKRVQDAAFADNAARGFTLPSGAMVSALARARQEAANNNAKSANEIAIAQAEMEQKNLQFAVTTSTGLRTAMVSSTLSYLQSIVQLNGQAIQYSKEVVDAVVEAYNILTRVFATRLEQVKTAVVIYDAQVKAAMSQVELYRSEIAALQALTQVDQSKVAVYTAQLGSMQALAAVYKVQVDAALSQISMEKAKVDLFQAQVQAYSAEVQAKSAEWQGYASAISGEEAKMRGYSAEVQAYGAEVQAFQSLVAAKKASLDGAVAVNQARSADYINKIESYRATIQGNVEEMKGKVSREAQKVATYGAQLMEVAKNREYDADRYKTNAATDTERFKQEWDAKVTKAKLAITFQETISKLHTANATIQGNMAQAALAGINVLAASTETV